MSLPLSSQVAVVTGASRGLGRATGLALAKAGAHVVAIARTVGALEELDDEIRTVGGSATLLPLDLREQEKIDALGPALLEKFGKLDILVGNAGMLGTLTPLAHQTPKEFGEVMAVNLSANWRLIRTLDPLLRASKKGKAVFVTSGITKGARPYWGAYAVSKSALEMMVGIYAAETAKTELQVSLFDPGAFRTKMRAAAFPGEDPMTLPTPETVAERLMKQLLTP
ncbi:MAG: SDR family NAD(P)-dependent oxidoreductase [Alphaproteobacteria bacterium]|nr:SDR family NAD(P)-dependent oxidoreductase [Alphaproteobacteria bacterium]